MYTIIIFIGLIGMAVFLPLWLYWGDLYESSKKWITAASLSLLFFFIFLFGFISFYENGQDKIRYQLTKQNIKFIESYSSIPYNTPTVKKVIEIENGIDFEYYELIE